MYGRNVIFKKVNPYPIIVQLKEDEKKLIFHLPPKTQKVELEDVQEVHDEHAEEGGPKDFIRERRNSTQILRSSTCK